MPVDNPDEFFNKYFKDVFAQCLGILNNRMDAEDVAMEVMAKFILSDGLDPKGAPVEKVGPYLRKIARNDSRNAYQKRIRRPQKSEDLSDQNTHQDSNQAIYDLYEKDFQNILGKLLTSREMEVIWKARQGFKIGEIASDLGISYDRVNELKGSAKKKIYKWVHQPENN